MGQLTAFSSVLTLTEVLAKPVQLGKEDLAAEFTNFLTKGLYLIEINAAIAERAGRSRRPATFFPFFNKSSQVDLYIANPLG